MGPPVLVSAGGAQRPPIDQQITFVYVRDLEASSRFYGGTLALPLALDQGRCRIYRTAAGAFLGVCIAGPRPSRPDGVVLSLVTDAVDAWHRHLAAAGVPIDGPPQERPEFGIYAFFARDPDGHAVEFQSFRRPDWPSA